MFFKVTNWLLLFPALFFVGAMYFSDYNFGPLTVDQFSFFVFTSESVSGLDSDLLIQFIIFTILIPLVLTFFGLKYAHRYLDGRGALKKVVVALLLCATLVSAFQYWASSFDLWGLQKRFAGEDRLARHFTPLKPGQFKQSNTRNLILLYVESLETIFEMEQHFGSDLNEPLHNALGRTNLKLRQAPGTGWTTAGMVASQCGMPLAPFMGNRLEKRGGPIFGNLTCLGDILKANGYEQHFLVGPYVKFSGMDKFYLNHGYDSALGKWELLETGLTSGNGTGWGDGIHDDELLDIAFDKIESFHKTGKRFNLTIATTDNHSPNGYLSPRCTSMNLSPEVANAVYCTNQAIELFVQKLKSGGVFEDTLMVIMGDHLFMGNLGGVQKKERYVYFNYVGAGSDKFTPCRDVITHFDVFPTILGLLFDANVGKIHIGRNAFAAKDCADRDLNDYIFGEYFLNYSQLYRSFWN